MSDKFFFKGRKDARQTTLTYGYERNASRIAGSKKYPLKLVVTNEARKHEVTALVAEAGLYADITVDTTEGAVESIQALTVILNKKGTVTVEKAPARNNPYIYNNNKKYKKCCG